MELLPLVRKGADFFGLTNPVFNFFFFSFFSNRGMELLPMVRNGADFFGLTNPVVQNLIQSCPGAKKCSGYKWIRFEINKAETNENVAVGKSDPTISFDSFHRLLLQHMGM